MTWRALLKGDSFALDTLATIFSDREPRVTRIDSEYFLLLSPVDSIEVFEVRDAARPILERMNGVARARHHAFRPARLSDSYISPGGEKRHVIIEVPVAQLFARAPTPVVLGEAEIDRDPAYLELASRDKNVDEALRLWGVMQEAELAVLYKIWEIVRDDVGGPSALNSKRWVSRKGLTLFTQTASSPNPNDPTSRHARSKADPPQCPMSPPEAERLIRVLTTKWLGTKLVSESINGTTPNAQNVLRAACTMAANSSRSEPSGPAASSQ